MRMPASDRDAGAWGGPLDRGFYRRPTLEVARDLVGRILVHRTATGVTAGVIVETEAYVGEDDPACHAASGLTPRNAPLYGPPGRAYVYLNYGLHWLVNAVTEPEGAPAAVLIRALEPLGGLPLMRRRRARARGRAAAGRLSDAALCRGPGNLTRAMGIGRRHNAVDLCGVTLYVASAPPRPAEVAWSERIGISVGCDRPWRCFVVGHPSVSGSRATEGAGARQDASAPRPR